MRNGQKRGKKANAAKKLTKQGLKRLLWTGGAVVGAALIVSVVFFLTRPQLVWHVDEDLSAAWIRILNETKPPFSRSEVIPRKFNESFPKGRFGFVISRSGPQGEQFEGVPAALYPDLSRSLEYKGWLVLALDPWMVFRKHQDPEPARSFLNNSNDRGSILLAGSDKTAVQAWLCQLLQETPGVFTQGNTLWEEKSRSLALDYPFQGGASTYSWVQVWPLLFREGISSVYAPLSQARALAPYRAGLLDATRFPEPENWNRYGLQADILWARMRGDEDQRKKLSGTEKWLKDPKTQTVIANMLTWIPAHASGVPYNTISWESQMAWLRCSFIWQGVANGQDS